MIRFAFILSLSLCSVASAQFTVEHRFVIDSPAANTSARSQPLTSGGVATEAAGLSSDIHVVLFTTKYCQPCSTMKAVEVPKLRAAGVRVTVIDVNQDTRWKIGTVPAVWIATRDGKKALKKWANGQYVTASRIQAAIAALEPPKPEPIAVTADGGKSVQYVVPTDRPGRFSFSTKTQPSTSSVYNGDPGSSHENRASLIDHLLNDGIHAGRHSQSELDAMTDQQLSDLHDEEHNAEVMRKPQWVRPGTRPQPVRRGWGLFR